MGITVIVFILFIAPVIALILNLIIKKIYKKDILFIDALSTSALLCLLAVAETLILNAYLSKFFDRGLTAAIFLVTVLILTSYLVLRKRYSLSAIRTSIIIASEIAVLPMAGFIYIWLFLPWVTYEWRAVPVEFCMYGELEYNQIGCAQDGLAEAADGKFFYLHSIYNFYNVYNIKPGKLVVFKDYDGAKKVGKIIRLNQLKADHYDLLALDETGKLATTSVRYRDITAVDY